MNSKIFNNNEWCNIHFIILGYQEQEVMAAKMIGRCGKGMQFTSQFTWMHFPFKILLRIHVPNYKDIYNKKKTRC